jgi:fumarylacetoacetate (FAA) hydrolase
MVCASEALGMDFSAQVAVITGDVHAGCAFDRAIDAVRLVLLANAPRLVHAAGAALPAAFSPVAATTDELGDAWARGRVHLSLQTTWNGRKVGLCDAGADMAHHFGHLIAHLGKSCNVRAGVIVGSGPVSNKGITKGTGARARVDYPKGYNSITEKRAMETLSDGQAITEYMKWGDTVRIDMKGSTGQSVFGAIEQEVVALPLSA